LRTRTLCAKTGISQIFDEQQNIIYVVVITTSLLVGVARTSCTNQPAMIDDASPLLLLQLQATLKATTTGKSRLKRLIGQYSTTPN
jgi:hypothetical protein